MRFLFTQRGAWLYSSVFAVVFSATALADPPTRVARLAYLSGTVSFDPAGSQDWVQAEPNRPLVTGDALWADQNSRAELNLGRSSFALDSTTSVAVTNLDDQTAQMELTQGTLSVNVRRLTPTDVVEVDTPNLAFTITRPGSYRLDVAPDGSSTSVTVRDGQANVSGQGQAYTIGANQSYRFGGTDLSDSTNLAVPPPDEFDRFVSEREQRYQHATSARYVSPDMIGYADLDENGTWQNVQGYGDVWTPTHVDADWAPYRSGHWAWVDPWGWTWVDDAAWGFAPFHYGRWARIGPRWGWIPGPARAEPVYAPAMVAFVGGAGFSLTVAIGGRGGDPGIGWFPLGPREIYRPSYRVSRAYINNINTSNTTVNNTYVTNNYNTRQVTYVNREAPGAVTAVPRSVFARGGSVQRAAVPVSRTMLARAQVVPVAAVAPTVKALASSPAARAKPPEQLRSRSVVAKKAPPPTPIPFAARAHDLAAAPGKPLAPEALAQLRKQTPASQAPRRVVIAAPSRAGVPPPAPPASARRAPSTAPGAAAGRTTAEPASQSNGVARPSGAARPPEQKPAATPGVAQKPEVARPPEQKPAATPGVAQRPEVARPPEQKPAATPGVAQRPEVARPSEVARPPQVSHPTEARPGVTPAARPEVSRPSEPNRPQAAPPTRPAPPEAARPPQRPETAPAVRPAPRPEAAHPAPRPEAAHPAPRPEAVRAPQQTPPKAAPKVAPPQQQGRPSPHQPTAEQKKQEEKKDEKKEPAS